MVPFDLKCKQSHLDKAVFRWYNNNKLDGIILLHVDDILVTGSNRFHDVVVQHVVTKFKVGKRQEGSFKYVGLKIAKTSAGIRVNQDNYSQEVLDINIDQKERTNDDKLKLNELRMLRSIIG